MPRAAPARPAGRDRPRARSARGRGPGSWSSRPAASCASPARPWATTRSTTATPTSLGRGRARGRSDRLPGRHRPRRPARRSREALSDQLVRADLVVTSGGVSKGDYDVVKDVARPLRHVWFDEVAMQPGKPQGFGTIGEDDTPIFTLPGNPVSAYVSFEVFVLPAIRRMMGMLPYVRPTGPRGLTNAGSRSPDGQVAARARGSRGDRERHPCHSDRRARFAPHRRALRAERADRRARRDDLCR